MSEVELKIPLAKQIALADKEGKTLIAWQADTKAKVSRMRVVAVRSYRVARIADRRASVEAENFQKKMDSAIA